MYRRRSPPASGFLPSLLPDRRPTPSEGPAGGGGRTPAPGGNWVFGFCLLPVALPVFLAADGPPPLSPPLHPLHSTSPCPPLGEDPASGAPGPGGGGHRPERGSRLRASRALRSSPPPSPPSSGSRSRAQWAPRWPGALLLPATRPEVPSCPVQVPWPCSSYTSLLEVAPVARALYLPIIIKILIILITQADGALLVRRVQCWGLCMRCLSWSSRESYEVGRLYYLLDTKPEAQRDEVMYSRPHSQLKGNGVFSFKVGDEF